MKYNDIKLKFPNQMVWNYLDENETYLKKYGDKIIHIFSYLQGTTNKFGKSCFTLEDLIDMCGMKNKTGRNNSTNQFKRILKQLQYDGIIQTNINFETVRLNTYIKCDFSMPFPKGEDNDFFCISVKDYEKIMECDNKKISRLTLLTVFYYINARLRRRKTSDESNVTNNDLAETFYDSYSTICSHLDITERTWNTYIKELSKLGSLFYGNIGKIKKSVNGKYESANNVYCINEIELARALKQSKVYYKNKGAMMAKKEKRISVSKPQRIRKIKIKTRRNLPLFSADELDEMFA